MIPDPLANPADSLTVLEKLYHSGAWIALVILVAFYGLTILSKQSIPWLQVGHRAAYLSSALGALAVLALPASQGTTPNLAMVVAALGAALTLRTNPKQPSQGSSTSGPPSSGPPLGAVALVMLAAIALGMTVGCAASTRQTTIKTALVTVDTTRDAFVAYDVAHQADIVQKAASIDDGKAQLAAYRVTRATVVTVLDSAYHAIAAAAVANDDPSLTGIEAALVQLHAAVAPYLGGSK